MLHGDNWTEFETLPVLNRMQLEEIRSVVEGERLLRDLIMLFCQEAPVQAAALFQAWEERDLPFLVRTAHRLKGSARSLGTLRLGKMCESLENQSRAGYLPLPDLRVPLQRALDETIDALSRVP